ncbi:hypothetical protein G9463_17365 [Haloarcula sp. JP-Z28]|uniref:hypothetical protein n=1 Tax=Haloarcula sp. JP-Z28 TaxID=2716715 RepID=UPI0014044531|nr:hypothetical protein [Haloarcula sp. JP-Z28]NHN65058.1 hypothetical protein [Haloarcula sp. JP-Z28]
MARRRTLKILTIATAVLSLFLTLRWRAFGLRIAADENNVIRDIQTIVINGSLEPPTQYISGNSYQIMAGTILELFGFDNWLALDWIAPIIGLISFSTICLITINFFRNSDDKMVWAAMFTPLVLWSFSGFVNRLTEATHKPFTHLIVFLLLYLAYRIGTSNRSQTRLLLVFSFLAVMLSTYNYVWATIYSTVALAVLFLTKGLEHQALTRNTVTAISLFCTVLFIPLTLPTTTLHIRYFRQFVYAAYSTFGSGTNTEPPSGSGEGSLAGWPTVDVFGAEISMWFIHVSGIIVSTLVAVLAGIIVVVTIARRSDDQRFSRLYLAVGLMFTILVAAIVAAGDIATLKRVIILPALIGVLYTVHYFHRSVTISSRQRNLLLSALFICLLFTAPLALPRALTNGEIAPTDTYADDGQVSKIEWYHQYPSDCLLTHSELDYRVSGKLSGLDPVATNAGGPANETDTVVYTAGEDNVLSCSEL